MPIAPQTAASSHRIAGPTHQGPEGACGFHRVTIAAVSAAGRAAQRGRTRFRRCRSTRPTRCRSCPRSPRATRATRSTPASTRSAHVIEGDADARPGATSTGAPQSAYPVPPLLERVPQQPVDVRSRRRAAARAQRRPRRAGRARFGYTHVQQRPPARRDGEADLTPTLRYIQPDDGNADDRTRDGGDEPRARSSRSQTARFHIELDVAHSLRRRRPRRLGPRLQLHRAVVPEDRRARGRASWNAHQFHPLDRVLLRLRRLRRAAHAARRLRGGRHRAGRRSARRQRRRHRDAALLPGGRPRLRVDGEPALPRAAGRASTTRLSAGRHPPAAAARARAPGERYIEAGHASRCATYGAWSAPYPYAADHRGRSRRGARPRAAWSTRRSSRAGPRRYSPADAAEPRGRHHPRGAATSSGTCSWPTTSSRRPGWTRGSTATTTARPRSWRSDPRAGAGATSGSSGRGSSGWPVLAPRRAPGPGRRRATAAAQVGPPDDGARDPAAPTPTPGTPNSYNRHRRCPLHTLEGLPGEATMTRVLRHIRAEVPLLRHPTSRDFIGAGQRRSSGRPTGSAVLDETRHGSGPMRPRGVGAGGGGRASRGASPMAPDGAPVPLPSPSPSVRDAPKGPYGDRGHRAAPGKRSSRPSSCRVEWSDGRCGTRLGSAAHRWIRFRYREPVKVRRVVVDPERSRSRT